MVGGITHNKRWPEHRTKIATNIYTIENEWKQLLQAFPNLCNHAIYNNIIKRNQNIIMFSYQLSSVSTFRQKHVCKEQLSKVESQKWRPYVSTSVWSVAFYQVRKCRNCRFHVINAKTYLKIHAFLTDILQLVNQPKAFLCYNVT